VVGNGAREDALSWRLSASPSYESLFHAPGIERRGIPMAKVRIMRSFDVGVVDPEEKRIRIGREFIAVFEEEA